MRYVISDLHGDYEKYREMLDLIHFGADDTLYVLGDIIDRGKNGLKILLHMMENSNIVPIVGNHELMAYRNLERLVQEETGEAEEAPDEERMYLLLEWIQNGGDTTVEEYRTLLLSEKKKVLEYLREFWGGMEVEVDGQRYVMIHGGFENFETGKPLNAYPIIELTCARMDVEKNYYKDKVIIFGHTPTRHYHAKNQGKRLEKLAPEEFCDDIYVSEDGMLIGIDCGCAHGGKLGCYCLDTKECFYV